MAPREPRDHRGGLEHLPHVPVLSREELGESPLWPALAVLSAASLYATLPTKFIAGSGSGIYGIVRWLVPALTILLLGPLVLNVPQQRLLRSAEARASALRLSRRLASIAVIAVISAANAASVILLVHFLVAGAQTNARLLLRAGVHMWCMNVLVFGLWFWQLDGGGPVDRRVEPNPASERDFLFPQQSEPELASSWQPVFIDYLYVSYTNATAFSPTDAMPLSKWAKLLMLTQSAASLLLAIMVVARAVNILK
ncbi:MAG TPA: hypothetical protein VF002_00060 [Gaiellaceae bacterium]